MHDINDLEALIHMTQLVLRATYGTRVALNIGHVARAVCACADVVPLWRDDISLVNAAIIKICHERGIQ